MAVNKIKRSLGLKMLLSTVLIVVLVMLLGTFYLRFDLTASKQYSLSSSTKELIARLELDQVEELLEAVGVLSLLLDEAVDFFFRREFWPVVLFILLVEPSGPADRRCCVQGVHALAV